MFDVAKSSFFICPFLRMMSQFLKKNYEYKQKGQLDHIFEKQLLLL